MNKKLLAIVGGVVIVALIAVLAVTKGDFLQGKIQKKESQIFVSVASTPASQTIAAGSQDVNVASFNVSAKSDVELKNIDYTVKKNEIKKLDVFVNVSDDVASGSRGISYKDKVTAKVTSEGLSLNGPMMSLLAFSELSDSSLPSGKLTISQDVLTPKWDIILTNSKKVPVATFKAEAKGEPIVIKKLTFHNIYEKIAGDMDNNVKAVHLSASDGIVGWNLGTANMSNRIFKLFLDSRSKMAL